MRKMSWLMFVVLMLPFLAPGMSLARVVSVGGQVSDAGGTPLPGDGLPIQGPEGYVQLLSAGPDGEIGPAGPGGAARGDDEVLASAEDTDRMYTAAGEGFPFSPAGRFYDDFMHALPDGARVYARAWNGEDPAGSTHYGESALCEIAGEFHECLLDPWQTDQVADFCGDGETRLCTDQLGVCEASEELCEEGIWPGCDYVDVPGYEPVEVSCWDGLDNDCDGVADGEDPDCPEDELDVDGDGIVLIDTDLVFLYRCLAGIDAVPGWYREIQEFRPDDHILAYVQANLDRFDVDVDGTVLIDTDLVFIYRCLVPLPAVPAWYRDIQEFPPDEEICALVDALSGGGEGSSSGMLIHSGTGIRETLARLNGAEVNLLEIGCLDEAGPGQGTVTVSVQVGEDLTRLTTTLQFDASTLEILDVRKTGRTLKEPDWAVTDPGAGTLVVSLFDIGADVIPQGEGPVLEILVGYAGGTQVPENAVTVTDLVARDGFLEVALLVQECSPEDPVWTVSEAAASKYGSTDTDRSDVLNPLIILMGPVTAIFLIRKRRKRKT